MQQIELNRRRIMAAISGGYEAVDLGLPSGKKWANMNIGATKPEGDGLYFSWGNLEGHIKNSGYNFNEATYINTPAASISADLTLEQDAAHIIMGGAWRMPTHNEFRELFGYTNKEWILDYQGTGISGYLFTNRNDNNLYVFFPCSGRYNGTDLEATKGYYWSKTMNGPDEAYYLLVGESETNPDSSWYKYQGRTIRAIQD